MTDDRYAALRRIVAAKQPSEVAAYARTLRDPDDLALLESIVADMREAAGIHPPSEWFCWREGCDGKPHEGMEHRHARWAQHPPPGQWLVWLILAGRGFGKSKAGAEWIAEKLRFHAGWRGALVGATFGDGRDTMIEGDSGILSVLPPSALVNGSVDDSYNRSLGEIHLANGSMAKLYSSERPRRLRGPQSHCAWGDEPFHWADAHLGDADDSTYSNLLLGLRLGPDPRLVLTSTPRRVRLLVGTAERPGVRDQPTTVITRGSTYDNLDNLAPTFRAQVLDKYEGTRLGRQELHAEVIDDVEGALWTSSLLEASRVPAAPALVRIVVGVDPAISNSDESDHTGIVVAGRAANGHLYVLADRSLRASPDGWARAVLAAYEEFSADEVVAEANQGGEMVSHVLRTVAPLMPVKLVHASRGKRTRAEPVAARFEQHIAHLVGVHVELEEELTGWVPGADSPDRLDAMVWAMVAVDRQPTSSGTAARQSIPRMPVRAR